MEQSGFLRKTGLEFLGELPWGSHLCQFYHQKEDLLETLIPFFKAGLEQGESCIWVTPPLIDVRQASEILSERIRGFGRYERRGQFEIISSDRWYLPGQPLDSKRLLGQLRAKVEEAHRNRFSGIRGAGGMHKIEHLYWRSLLDYERQVHREIVAFKIIVLCAYSLPHCPLRNIAKVIDCHHKTFLKKGWAWEIVNGQCVV